MLGEGDGMALLARYCLHRFHILPRALLRLGRSELAFLAACAELDGSEGFYGLE